MAGPDAPQPDRDHREVARQLASTIDRAMSMGLWEHAERVAASAVDLAREHPVLGERVARLRLAQGDAEAALAAIDSCVSRPASLRLLRAVCLLQLGRRDEAHMDLHRWARRSTAPIQARLILGLLEWAVGDDDAAIAALRRNIRQIEAPRTLAALTLVCAAQGRAQQAATWGSRLRDACAWSDAFPESEVLLRSLGLEGINVSRLHPPRTQVSTLATELLANEQAIPALVEAQHLRPQPASASLLMSAIEQALPDLENAAAAYVALARLALILGDEDAALHWAQRGLDANPLSSSLARIIADIRDHLAHTPSPWEEEPSGARLMSDRDAA